MLRGHCFPNSDSSVAYKFRYELCNEFYYGECVRHLTVRSDGILPSYHIGISPLTNRRVQPRKYSAVCHQLLNCNHSFTFEDFSVLYYESKKYLLELKHSLFIMRVDSQWIKTHIPVLSICLNEFLSHCLLHTVDFCDQFFSYFT